MSKLSAENLFRREAIDSLRKGSTGRPIGLMPRPWAWLTVLLVCFMICAGCFVFTAEYSRKESARGWLVSDPGVIRITHGIAAQVRQVVVRPGDRVDTGDPIIYVSTDSLMQSGNSMSDAVLGKLRQDLVELDIQLELSRRQELLQSASIDAQLAEYDSESRSILAQVDDQRRRIALHADKLNRLESAAGKGAVSDMDVLQEQQSRAGLEQELELLRQKNATQKRDREQLSGYRSELPTRSRLERSSLRLQRSQLLQQIAEFESKRTSVLSAPVAGVVASVEIHAGNTIIPQQLLATILPDDIELSAEIYVPSRAVGLIRSGQVVHLAYDAFPKQKFGTFDGHIEHISEYVLLPRDVTAAFPMAEATYKVQVHVADLVVETRNGQALLRPGMLLVADIVLEKRTIIEWLFEPLGLTGFST